MITPLEVLHRRIEQDGGLAVREQFPNIHHIKFNSYVAGMSAVGNDVIESRVKELWPDDFVEKSNGASVSEEVDKLPSNFGVNQLNFTILMPVRNTYDPATVNSVVGLIRRTGCGWIQRPFDSMISRSRNILAKHFLASDYEWSFWIDDDMVIPNGEPNWFRASLGSAGRTLPDEFAGMIAPYQLASWGKTMVSGVYYSRHGNNQITAGFNKGTSIKVKLPHRSLLPVRYFGFGCAMIHRKVFEDILAKNPRMNEGDGQYFTPEIIEVEGVKRLPGEDEIFALRAADAGHNSFLDMSVVAGHCGRQVNYIPEGSIP